MKPAANAEKGIYITFSVRRPDGTLHKTAVRCPDRDTASRCFALVRLRTGCLNVRINTSGHIRKGYEVTDYLKFKENKS